MIGLFNTGISSPELYFCNYYFTLSVISIKNKTV